MRHWPAFLLLVGSACLQTPTGSVGAMLARDNRGQLMVLGVPERAVPIPPERTLLQGDRILMVDGISTTNLSLGRLRSKLRGDVGSTVVLTVEREGRILTLRIERSGFGKP